MKGDISAADLLGKDRHVPIRRRENDAVPLEGPEIPGGRECGGDSVLRHGGVVDPIGTLEESDARILDAERFVTGGGRQGGSSFDFEMNTVG
jgi:hypothetical protein